MWDEPIDLFGLQFVGFQNLIDHFGEVNNRMTEDFGTIHMHGACCAG